MPRQKRDFGLPRLTVQGAAHLLRVPIPVFRLWAFERCAPSKGEWSRWNNDTDTDNANKSRPLPEAIIRLYLMEHRRNRGPASRRRRAATAPAVRRPRVLKPPASPTDVTPEPRAAKKLSRARRRA